MEPLLIKYSWPQLKQLAKETLVTRSEYERIRKSILYQGIIKGWDPDMGRTIFAANFNADMQKIEMRLNELRWEVQRRNHLVCVL